MSIASWVGKAALVGSLLMVAHSEAHALARKTAYRPMESLRAAERAHVVDWRGQLGKLKAGALYLNAQFIWVPRCLVNPTSCVPW